MGNGNHKPILTVSIAAYNVEAFLANALSSCLIANNDEIEIIVVDDGSTDSTLQIANSYAAAHPGIFHVIAKENGGYGSTLNASLAIAKGKYYRFLDGDDWFDTEELEQYVELLKDTDADVSFTSYNRVFDADGTIETCDCLDGIEDGLYKCRQIAFKSDIAACATTYRTELLKRIGLTITEHCFYTDVEYVLLPLAHVNTAHVCHLPVYQYRIGREGQSVSFSGIRAHWKDHLRVTNRLVEEFEKKQDLLREWPQLHERLAGTIAYDYFTMCCVGVSDETEGALKKLDETIRSYPDTYRIVLRKSWRARLLDRLTLRAFPLCSFLNKLTILLTRRV